MKTHSAYFQTWTRVLTIGVLAAGLTAGVRAENEDEWYDPTDWFDGNNVEADDDYNQTPRNSEESEDLDEDWDRFSAGGRDGQEIHDPFYWGAYSWYADYDLLDESKDRGKMREIAGTVERVTEVDADEAPEHVLLHVRLENGSEATVDLGPDASLEKIGLQKGEKITVRGRSRTLGDRKVLAAELLRIDGREVASVSGSGKSR